MNKPIAIITAAILGVAGGVPAYLAATGPDTLTRIIDGDTIVINGSTHVRLWGMDAPELGQTCTKPNSAFAGGMRWYCGLAAKKYLESYFKLKVQLRCEKRGKDPYGRTLAICYIVNPSGEKHDIGWSLVAAGMAVDYTHFSNGYYAKPQEYAKANHLGVWSGTFDMPWDWRAAHSK